MKNITVDTEANYIQIPEKDLAGLIASYISDLPPYDMDINFDEDRDPESVLEFTLGYTPEDGTWGYQTGDNSYTGGAYSHPFWGVTWLTSESDPEETAKELLNEIAEQMYQ